MKKYTVVLLLGYFFAITACCQMERYPAAKGAASFGQSAKSEVYHGVLPCASCPGIDTWLLLYNDGDGRYFRMVERYLEEKDAVFLSEGSVIEKDNATIVLQKGEVRQNYLVRGDKLYLQGEEPFTSGKEELENTDYMLRRMPVQLYQ